MIVFLICLVSFEIFQLVNTRHRNDSKIVGGKYVADIRQMPWLVNIQMEDVGHICGGSVLSPIFVVSACHCLVNEVSSDKDKPSVAVPVEELTFVAGTLQSVDPEKNDDPHKQTRKADYLLIHPKCRDENRIQVFDYALAVLHKPFLFNDYVKSINILSMQNHTFEEKLGEIVKNPKSSCYVAGWGEVRRGPIGEEDEGIMSKKLKMMEMNLISDDKCREMFAHNNEKFETFDFKKHHQLCAIGSNRWGSDCQGDSGGPLVCEGYQIALVSYGFQCGTSSPGTYADLGPFVEWFNESVLSYVYGRKASTAPAARNPHSASYGYVLINLLLTIVAVS
uniref:Polyserase-2 n=1 Tax=Lygus hesperus TaxID=30085 RepID=A0A0A9WUF5_LYGHE